MGRKSIDPKKKKVRLDVYIEQQQKDYIKENNLSPEIDKAINEICKELKNEK